MATPLRPFRERILQLGAESNIIGIVTEPAPDTGASRKPSPALPMVIFLNAGVLHRVGPHRLHVFLARQLAQSGFPGLRLDLSGIGDSRGVPGEVSFRASAVADARAAMDRVSADTGVARFVLFGLCSGADNALATAQVDPRVVGLVLIDAPAFATWYSFLRGLRRRLAARIRHPVWSTLRSLRSVRMHLHQHSAQLGVGSKSADDSPDDPESAGRQSPPQAEYGALLKGLLDRGTRILSVYSGGLGQRYNHRDQLFEVFPALRGRLEVAFFPAANHVFTELAQRNELIVTVTRWCGDHFA